MNNRKLLAMALGAAALVLNGCDAEPSLLISATDQPAPNPVVVASTDGQAGQFAPSSLSYSGDVKVAKLAIKYLGQSIDLLLKEVDVQPISVQKSGLYVWKFLGTPLSPGSEIYARVTVDASNNISGVGVSAYGGIKNSRVQGLSLGNGWTYLFGGTKPSEAMYSEGKLVELIKMGEGPIVKWFVPAKLSGKLPGGQPFLVDVALTDWPGRLVKKVDTVKREIVETIETFPSYDHFQSALFCEIWVGEALPLRESWSSSNKELSVGGWIIR